LSHLFVHGKGATKSSKEKKEKEYEKITQLVAKAFELAQEAQNEKKQMSHEVQPQSENQQGRTGSKGYSHEKKQSESAKGPVHQF
jgi:signal transduction histidine kinase